MNCAENKELAQKAKEIRKLTLTSIAKVGKGHIGGALSLCEVMSVLYFKHMNVRPDDPLWDDRDRFVLSKGHAGPVVYAALVLRGFLDPSELETMNHFGSMLPSHCDRKLTRGIDMSTGSLGQGFAAAAGMALGAKLDKKDCFIYAIIGDGESQEGLIWETAMLAGSRRLDHFIAFTDYNKMQIDGYIGDVNDLEPLDKKWEAFGWQVQSIDGHDIGAIDFAIETARKTKGKPSMIILNTAKGKGAYFAENKLESHSMNITEEMYVKALAEIEGREVCL